MNISLAPRGYASLFTKQYNMEMFKIQFRILWIANQAFSCKIEAEIDSFTVGFLNFFYMMKMLNIQIKNPCFCVN